MLCLYSITTRLIQIYECTVLVLCSARCGLVFYWLLLPAIYTLVNAVYRNYLLLFCRAQPPARPPAGPGGPPE